MLMIIFVPLYLSSCDKEDDSTETLSEIERYYVRYECSTSYGHSGFPRCTIYYVNENGQQEMALVTNTARYGYSWEGQYGPFKKGDIVSLNIKAPSQSINGRIYVSLNAEPFIVKAEGKNDSSLSLSYTIDY